MAYYFNDVDAKTTYFVLANKLQNFMSINKFNNMQLEFNYVL